MRNYRQPAEWEEHEACWLAWPSHRDLWLEDLDPVQAEFIALCHAISGMGYPSVRPVERLQILVPDAANEELARQSLRGLPITFHQIAFGDIWLRDTGPIFTRGEEGLVPTRFGFNGWGGKYVLPNDPEVSSSISNLLGGNSRSFPWILEGGSVEVDGQGTCLTTEQCLLNPNRNPGFTKEKWEGLLSEALGVTRIIWLKDGLVNDHTDGHIDTLARFVLPGVVLCMTPKENNDPNARQLNAIRAALEEATDAAGHRLEVVTVRSPGKVTDRTGRTMAASYMNFYISNRTVVVPTYGVAADEMAVAQIAALFPDRTTIGLSARRILLGGGAFHCITQQQPKGVAP